MSELASSGSLSLLNHIDSPIVYLLGRLIAHTHTYVHVYIQSCQKSNLFSLHIAIIISLQ